LHLENFGMRVYDLILRPPDYWVCLTDRLEEAIGRF
jgi:hypothetical protein